MILKITVTSPLAIDPTIPDSPLTKVQKEKRKKFLPDIQYM